MKSILLTLHAQTSIHAGSGQDDNVIDLPVQREAHTGYPCIFGSSMKGALRAHAETRAKMEASAVSSLFGKEGGADSGNAGAILVSDARLLLLPVRSLMGQFRWVACPAVLRRFKQDAKRFGRAVDVDVPTVGSGKMLTSDNKKTIYLEEYRFSLEGEIAPEWVKILAGFITYENAEEMLKEQLVLISDDDFAYLAKYTLPVNPHIALDSKTKTTVQGALWYEETLPSDTILYVGIAVDDERKQGGGKGAEELTAGFKSLFADKPWLQIGGNETVGMGWCSVTLQGGEE